MLASIAETMKLLRCFDKQIRPKLHWFRADHNTGGAFSESSVKTAMHGTSCVFSAISVCNVYQSLTTLFQSEPVARLVRRWTIDHRTLSGESPSPLVDSTCIYQQICFGYDFYFSFMLGLVDL